MKSGKRKHCLSLQKKTITKSESGEEIPVYEELFKIWGLITPLNGREYWSSQQIQSETTHKITIPYIRGLNNQHILVYNDRKFYIQSFIDVDEKNQEFVLMCRENNNE